MAYTTIDDPSAHFHTQLYSGDGNTNRDITNDANAGDFQPDFLWLKNRTDSSTQHFLFNSNVGMPNHLNSDLQDVEQTATNKATAFNADGFRVQDHSQVNGSGKNYVAWQWKANGGTTSSNSDGGITSTVQANTTAGFSIVTYTGGGSATTVGHGLGKVPSLIILKRRDSTNSWLVKHQNSTSNKNLQLHTTNAELTTSDFTGGIIGDLSSSTVFSTVAGSSGVVNVSSSNDFIAYCFAEIKGYSKFGSYTGNNSTNGVFVYTGFKPAWLMVKRTSSTANWDITTAAISQNQIDERLRDNLSNAEESSGYVDFLSNGFKMRNTNSSQNNGTYIYLAFAEHPFVSSKGVPATAR